MRLRHRIWQGLVYMTLVACRDVAEVPLSSQATQLIGGDLPTGRTARAASLSIDGPALDIAVGAQDTLSATASDRFDNRLASVPVRWDSSDTTIVSISAVGALRARQPGVAWITARSDSLTDRRLVVVRAANPTVVDLRPELDVAALVAQSAPGTTFRLAPGTYRRLTVLPKDGMTFIGGQGVVFDGEQVTPYAFRADSGATVTLRGLTIRRYRPPLQDGAISADGSDGWVIDSCVVAENTTGGIRLGSRMVVRRSSIHHNGQIGLLGGGDGIVVEDTEIAHNNPDDRHDMYWEAGGTKFARTRDLTVRRNFVHDNHGPGIWTDIDNVRATIVDNRVEQNYEAGILHEISYRALIRGNTLRGNGTHAVPEDDVTGAGILVSVSQDVEVIDNIVENNKNGIVAIQDERGAGVYGTYGLRQLTVRGNTVTPATGVSGVITRGVRRLTDASTYAGRGLRFEGNTYRVSTGSKAFVWGWRRLTLEGWRALGQDTSRAP